MPFAAWTALRPGRWKSRFMTELPSLDTPWAGRHKALLRVAQAYGARHYFTGEGGDNVLAPESDYVADLYLAGYRGEAMQRAAQYARYKTMSPRTVKQVLQQTVRMSYAQSLRELAAKVRAGEVNTSPLAVRWCDMYDTTWWTSEAKRMVAEELLQLAEEAEGQTLPPASLHGWQSVRRVAQGRAFTHELARSMGMVLHVPFLDTEVVHTCFSLPSYLHVVKGVFKPLLSASFNSELPALLLRRTTKTMFNGSAYRGIKVNQAAIREIIQSSRLAEAGLVDRQELLRVLTQAALGLKIPTGHLRSFISVELWLAHLDLRKATWWKDITL